MSQRNRRRLKADQFLGGYHLGERMDAIREIRKEKNQENDITNNAFKADNPQIKDKSEMHLYRKRRIWWNEEKPKQDE